MKKLYFLSLFYVFFFFNSSLNAQLLAPRSIIANGGIFGVSSNNVNLQIFEQGSQLSRSIDTIQTQSVQDLLIDGIYAYVAAQDSIVKYDLRNEVRVAAVAFPGASCRSMALRQNELWVGNWYGQTTDNLYIFDSQSLAVLDTIQDLSKGAKSILFFNNHAYVSQNTSNASTNYADSLGYIVEIDLQTKLPSDTLTIPSYSGQLLELIPRKDSLIFYSLNPVSNTISVFDLTNNRFYNRQFNQLEAGNPSQYSMHRDTLFLKMNGGIGALNIKDLTIIDSLIVDTLVTAFAYDTIIRNFHITQTDFVSFQQGAMYSRAGVKSVVFQTGSAPEAIKIWYDGSVGIKELKGQKLAMHLYPNPANDWLNVETERAGTIRIIDMLGRVYIEKRIIEGSQQIDLSQLSAGQYVVQFISNQEELSKILLKQ